MSEPTERLQWRKAVRCGTNACVEVACAGDRVYLRDSKNPEVAPLAFTRQEWSAFTASVSAGEFDFA